VVNLKFVAVNTFSVLEVRTQTLGNAAPCQEQSTEAIHENSLNIDKIIDPELHLTRVKVLTLWPSGRTDVQACRRKEDTCISLLKNVASKNWQAELSIRRHSNPKY